MRVDKRTWELATENLNVRRKERNNTDDNIKLNNNIRNYGEHLRKCGYGSSVLDVGCGSQTLKTYLPDSVEYIGIDAFPIVPGTHEIEIEDKEVLKFKVDTVCAFAVLDNCMDFYKACENMIRIAQKNIIILTGIGIEVDKFHTFKLEHSHYDNAFKSLTCTHKELVSPKVWLLCYQK